MSALADAIAFGSPIQWPHYLNHFAAHPQGVFLINSICFGFLLVGFPLLLSKAVSQALGVEVRPGAIIQLLQVASGTNFSLATFMFDACPVGLVRGI